MLPKIVILAVLFEALSDAAIANVIWPAAILTERLLSWWVIAASLLIEFLFVWWAFRLPPLKALLATIAANAASAAIGLFALPYLGLFWEAALFGTGIGVKINWDAFSPAGWAVTFLLAVGLSLGIELAVYRYGFKLPVNRRVVWLLLLANIITAGIAFISLDIIPDPTYGRVSPSLFPN
jgi:hypothetical protein